MKIKRLIEQTAFAFDLDPDKLAIAFLERAQEDQRYAAWGSFSGIETVTTVVTADEPGPEHDELYAAWKATWSA